MSSSATAADIPVKFRACIISPVSAQEPTTRGQSTLGFADALTPPKVPYALSISARSKVEHPETLSTEASRQVGAHIASRQWNGRKWHRSYSLESMKYSALKPASNRDGWLFVTEPSSSGGYALWSVWEADSDGYKVKRRRVPYRGLKEYREKDFLGCDTEDDLENMINDELSALDFISNNGITNHHEITNSSSEVVDLIPQRGLVITNSNGSTAFYKIQSMIFTPEEETVIQQPEDTENGQGSLTVVLRPVPPPILHPVVPPELPTADGERTGASAYPTPAPTPQDLEDEEAAEEG